MSGAIGQSHPLAPLLAKYFFFYLAHLVGLLCGTFAYLFLFKPEYLDLSSTLWAVIIIIWTAYNSAPLSKLLGYQSLASYRDFCIRRFHAFSQLASLSLIPLLLVGTLMIKELWSRWTYVQLVKTFTLDDSREGFRFPSPEELARAFALYPHRREVPFILARTSRLLAFDDSTSNYNLYIARFLERLNGDVLLQRYADPKLLDNYTGALDPVVYLARLTVDANKADPASLTAAIHALDTYRPHDGLARFCKLVFQHELYQHRGEREQLADLKHQMSDSLDVLRKEQSAQTHAGLVTSHSFQELAQHIQFLNSYAELAEAVRIEPHSLAFGLRGEDSAHEGLRTVRVDGLSAANRRTQTAYPFQYSVHSYVRRALSTSLGRIATEHLTLIARRVRCDERILLTTPSAADAIIRAEQRLRVTL